MIEGPDEITAFRQLGDPVETNCVNPFENISIFPMLRGMAMLLDKALDILETCNDPFLLRRA